MGREAKIRAGGQDQGGRPRRGQGGQDQSERPRRGQGGQELDEEEAETSLLIRDTSL